jgi:nucleotide-binding universal stress UspA family protein
VSAGDGDAGRTIRRILVALDASPDSLAAVEASAALAAALEAELIGLYVEDVNVLRLVGRATATEIDFLSGRPRPLGRRDLERQLRGQASRARRTLEKAARSLSVRWSFRTTRGRVPAELRSAEADLITLGVRGHGPGRGPGSTVRELLEVAGAPVLVTRRGVRIGGTVHVLHDGGATGERAVEIAARVARGGAGALTVLMVAPADRGPEVEEAQLREQLRSQATRAGDEPPDVRIRWLPAADAEAILGVTRRDRCGLLILPRSGPVSDLRLLLRRVHCPVLVVD